MAIPVRQSQSADPLTDYGTLGVRPFINCCGSRTVHGGSLMLPCVQDAMTAAATAFVNIDELMEGVGERLAELTGAERGIVAVGAAAALCHAAAACATGGDPEKLLRLPDTRGSRDRVLMPAGGRFAYDHAIRATGVRIVEVESLEELAVALDDRVAMLALLGSHESEWFATLEEMVALTRAHGIPVVVDAASEHLSHPEPYLSRGASLVTYSGGKYLRGPQSSGLLLGEEKWVRAAWVAAAPHHTLGRTMKVGKEEILGVLAAVEHWATQRDHEAERSGWETDLQTIAAQVTDVAGVTAEVLPSMSVRSPTPRLVIRWDRTRTGVTGLQLRDRLLEGEPRIMLDDRGATDSSVFILPFSLQPGEAAVVGARIREALSAAEPRVAEERSDPAPVAGTWEVDLEYPLGTVRHRVTIEQEGGALTGVHRTLSLESPVVGRILGTRVELSSLHRFEGTHLAYRFTGTAAGGEMAGSVEVGTSGQSAPGPINQREYGTVSFHATRT